MLWILSQSCKYFHRIGPVGQFFLLVKMSVRVCVRLSISSLLRYRLKVFLPPLPEVRCPKGLEIWNPWGKVTKEVVSYLKTLQIKGVKLPHQKKVFFWANFAFLSKIFLVLLFLTPFNGFFAPTSQRLRFILPCRSDFQPFFSKKQGIYSLYAKL